MILFCCWWFKAWWGLNAESKTHPNQARLCRAFNISTHRRMNQRKHTSLTKVLISTKWTPDSEALNVVLAAFTKTVFSWLRKKAKKNGVLEDGSSAHPGGISFIQRFGSSLNLNVQMHAVFSNGVFIENASSAVKFHRTPAPTLEEIRLHWVNGLGNR